MFHDGIDVRGSRFEEELSRIDDPCFVFVSLGDDELDAETAVALRAFYRRRGSMPQILSVVHSPGACRNLASIRNFKGEPYDIRFVGDYDSLFSCETIRSSSLEREALARHLQSGKEEDFWNHDYNYRSSMASALHRRMKIACGIPGAALPPEERSEEERLALRILEHRRWNAYVRSEGYRLGPRDDLAKTHPCLVPFDELSPEEKEKDDR